MTKLDVLNPATNEVIKILEYTDEQTAHRQIERAHEAFQSWKQVDAHERSAKLFEWARLVDEHKNELAKLITQEGGKPYKEAQGEVDYANFILNGMQKKQNVSMVAQFLPIHHLKDYCTEIPSRCCRCNYTLEFPSSNDYT